jgi:hypothetical protein
MKTPRQILIEKAKRYREQNDIHSRGPWEVQEHSGSQYVVSLPDDATICQMTTDDDAEIVERDALLIAAAPDMLAALEWILEHVNRCTAKDSKTDEYGLGKIKVPYGVGTVVDAHLILSKIKAAIKKAKGE